MNYLGYILLGLQVAALIALVPTYIHLERVKQATIIDVATIFGPGILWFCLLCSGIRSKSLSNLVIEPMILLPIIVAFLLIRTFATINMSNLNRSRSAFYSGVLVAIAVYVLVPLLPE
jgi:hypothetical protein